MRVYKTEPSCRHMHVIPGVCEARGTNQSSPASGSRRVHGAGNVYDVRMWSFQMQCGRHVPGLNS